MEWELRTQVCWTGFTEKLHLRSPEGEGTGSSYLLRLHLHFLPAQGGWSQMMLIGSKEDPGLGYWQETEAPLAACGQLLPLLGDVSHSLGWGPLGYFWKLG